MQRSIQQVKQFAGCRSQVDVIDVDDPKVFRINVMPPQPQRNGDEVIDMSFMESGEEIQNQPANDNFLRRFLQWMHNIGMSTYNPDKDHAGPHTRLHYYTDILLKVAFWTSVIFALASSFLDAKYNWLAFLSFGGLVKFVNFGFHVITILVQVFLMRLFAFLHENITDMLEKLDELNQLEADQKELQQEKRENRWLKALVITTILKSLLLSGLDNAVTTWSIEKTIDDKSIFLYKDINMWKADDLVNYNVTDQINDDFSEMTSAVKVTMGLAQMMMDICCDLKLETAVDMVIIAGLCLLKYTRRLKVRVKKVSDNHDADGNDSAVMDSPSGNWAYYQKLAAANKAINLVMDELLKMMHAYNAMKFAYFLMRVVENKATASEFLYLLYSCGKVSVAYLIAKQTNEQNAVFQEWIIDWGLRSTELGFALKAMLALKKMELWPLGMGSGNFKIGESFILQFGGMVGSNVMLQVDKADG